MVLTGASIGTGILFHKVNPIAGYLFIPYVAWLCFASLLNYSLLSLNCKKSIEAEKSENNSSEAEKSK